MFERFKNLVIADLERSKAKYPIKKRVDRRLFPISGDEAVDDDWYINQVRSATSYGEIIDCMRSTAYDIRQVVALLINAGDPTASDELIGGFTLQDWDT